ncbi:MAG: helix-turn-helix transcriptional regulator [Clostridia bacterium]|nr:helix-turn-helix transcriptional regulator [Clostridia bacterium]
MDNTFGTRLKQLRTEKGYTQREFAARLGVSASAIGMYEQGRREPDNTVLAAMCKLLDTTPDYLIGFTPREQSEEQDIGDVIDDFTKLLMSQQGLMFNGQPMTAADREKIVIAIKSAAAIVIPKTGKE